MATSGEGAERAADKEDEHYLARKARLPSHLGDRDQLVELLVGESQVGPDVGGQLQLRDHIKGHVLERGRGLAPHSIRGRERGARGQPDVRREMRSKGRALDVSPTWMEMACSGPS